MEKREPKLDHARRLRWFYFIDPDDQDYKETLKKLERPVAADMPCTRMVHTSTTKVAAKQEIASQKILKTMCGCVVESHESTRQRVEYLFFTTHEDRIAGKGSTSMTTTIFGSQISTYASSNEDSGCKKLQWTRNGKSSRQLQHSNWKTSRVRRSLFSKHKETKRKSTLLHWWTSATSKNAELEPKLQKYKGRVVLRGDIVKDDSGAFAVITEQGSSASQMTAAKVMDVIARLPDCDGQAADPVSACTQVKLEDASRLLKIPKSGFPDVWIRLLAKILVEHWRSCGTSRTKFIWTPTGRIVMGQTIRGRAVGT